MSENKSFPLIVPIHLDGLCVGLPDSQLSDQQDTRALFAGQEFDFSALPASGTSDSLFLPDTVETQLFAEEQRNPGVYLHWELPGALRHGNSVFQITSDVCVRLKHLGFPDDLVDKQLAPINDVFQTRESFEKKVEDTLDAWLRSKAVSGVSQAAQKAWYAYYILQAAGNFRFPNVPDRWLVIRQNFGPQGGSPLPEKYWLIESDFLSVSQPDHQDGTHYYAKSVAIPSPYAPDKDPKKTPYRFAGRVRLLSEVSGPEASFESWADLTATGPGLPSYSGFLPNCPNVFGHMDSLADLIEGQEAGDSATFDISYIVVGWHHKPDDDPLYGGNAGDQANQLQWTFPGLSGKTGDELQQMLGQLSGRTIYCGMLQKVQWNRQHGYKPASPQEDATLIVANNPAEALSAYLASDKPLDKQSPLTPEEKLEALQMGILREVEKSRNPELVVENALHENGFRSEPGGFIWQLSPVEQTAEADKTKDPFYHQSGEDWLEVYPDLGVALNELNLNQEKFNRLVRQGDAQRWQLYAYWVNYLQAEAQGTDEYKNLQNYLPMLGDPKPDPDANLGLQNFPALEKELQDTSKAILDGLAAILGKLNTYKAGEGLLQSKYRLEVVPAPRFWQANDPVLMLIGDNPPSSSRLDDPGPEDGSTLCRLSGQLLAAAGKKDGFSGSASAAEKSYLDGEIADFSAIIDQLLAEAVYLQGISQDALHAGQAAVAPASGFFPPAKGRTIWGIPAGASSGGVTKANPWHPVMLHWQINLHYPQRNGTQYPGDYIKQLATLSPDHVSLQYQAGALDTLVKAQRTYNGSMILSRKDLSGLKNQMDRYFEFSGSEDSDLKKWSQQVQDKQVFSQAINGWNDILLMRKRCLKVPVYDPQDNTSEVVEVVVQNVGRHNHATPQPDYWFSPIRCGFMEVEKIRLIDVFGQYRDINPRKVIQPSRWNPDHLIASGGASSASSSWFLLPPRITQPARLQFRWLAAEPGAGQQNDLVEMNSHPASSPICGWVAANHLDGSLMIFESDGRHMGALGQEKPLSGNWSPAPGVSPALQVADIRNKHLRNFADALNRKSATDLSDFRSQIDRVLQCIEPQTHHDNALAVLMSRPLVLAQVTLALELHGLPALNQSQDSYQGFFGGDASGLDNQGFNEVLFPVRLGDLSSLQDGLVGFFKMDENQDVDFSTFFTEDMDQYLWLKPGDSQKSYPQQLLLLIDPRARVHATSGILPVKSIQIPPAQYTKALQSLEYSFETGPILTASEEIRIPLPAETKHPWAWVSQKPGSGDWMPEEKVRSISEQARFNAELPKARQGWLKVRPFSAPKQKN